MTNYIRFTADGIYENLNADDDYGRYKYVIPNEDDNGQYFAIDCWIVDINGNLHPGYNVAPVPVNCENIGGMIKHMQLD